MDWNELVNHDLRELEHGFNGGPPRALAVGMAKLPSRFGDFSILAFANNVDGKEHVAVLRGDVMGASEVPTRLHSECLTGDALGSLRCDCRQQLERSLDLLGTQERGILVYLRQEGRGIGLTNKIRAYSLQDGGLDTVDANRALGFGDDERDYTIAALILERLGVKSIRLMTNNPDKERQLRQAGIDVAARVAVPIPSNAHNHSYLATKARRLGHWLSIEPHELVAAATGREEGRGLQGQARIAVFTGVGRVEIRREAIPKPRAGEALVRLRSCGLCTFEQRLWQGAQNEYPIAPGHEAAGEVVEVHSKGDLEVRAGDRVAIAFLDRCMQCYHCRRGETNLCTGKLRGRAPGKLRRIGGLADCAVVPGWKLFAMPETLSFDEITLCEPVACVIHSIHKGGLRFGDDVLVIGAGTMGHLHLLLARLRGARVFVSDPDPRKRKLALEHGASAAFEPAEAVEGIRHWTQGRGADAVFVTYGDPRTAAQAGEAVRRGGRIVYYGSFPAEAVTGLGPREIHHHEILLDGARGQTLEDWSEAARLLASGVLQVRHLITAAYPLSQLEDALRHAAEPQSFRIVVQT